jgi:hypothetical protein
MRRQPGGSEMRMHARRVLIGVFGAALVGATLSAQAP